MSIEDPEVEQVISLQLDEVLSLENKSSETHFPFIHAEFSCRWI